MSKAVLGRPGPTTPSKPGRPGQRRRAARFFVVFFRLTGRLRAVFFTVRLLALRPRLAALDARFFTDFLAAFLAFGRLRAAAFFFAALRFGAERGADGIGAGPLADPGMLVPADAAGAGFSGVPITDPPIALGSVD